ncbi:MAG TPA: hypothetical protein VHL80_19295 [Polyangia bacterium]|nr:hypothetical protein [Polyangia bacterium]
MSAPARSAAVAAVALALSALGAGCGDSNGGTSDPADAFVGTWSYNEVQSVLQCPNAAPVNQLPDPNKTFARGVSSALVDLSQSPLLSGVFCNFQFDIDGSGTVATARTGQTCALTSLDSVSIDDTTAGTSLWTFTLNSATTAEEIVQATAHFQITGTIQSCSWNLLAHLTRVSKE